MNKLLIVTCTKTKTPEEFMHRPLYASLKKQCDTNPNIEFHIFNNNTRGLSVCYNEVLRDPKHKNKTVLFVHDDVVLEDLFLYEKLMSSPYSITGLAGAKTFDTSKEKLAWHLCSQPNNYVGEVTHCHGEKVWTTCFGPTNARALIVDGLFISCKINDINEGQLEFDEQFDFHFYDIAFCFQANKKHVKCGVMPIRVVHYGIGDSMLTPEWEKANKEFKQKYCI
jgi:hypothetical protein